MPQPPTEKDPITWPFKDPKDTLVFTVSQILEGLEPINRVTHDEDDGAWQFLPGHDRFSSDDGRMATLREIFELDQSIALLADLERGGQAWRKASYLPWQRIPKLKLS